MLQQSEKSQRHKDIINLLNNTQSDLSSPEIGEEIDVHRSTLHKDLAQLEADDEIVHTRSVRGTKFYKSQAVHTLQSKWIEAENAKEIVLSILSITNKDICAMDIKHLTHLSSNSLNRAMRDLEADGKIEKTRSVAQSNFYQLAE